MSEFKGVAFGWRKRAVMFLSLHEGGLAKEKFLAAAMKMGAWTTVHGEDTYSIETYAGLTITFDPRDHMRTRGLVISVEGPSSVFNDKFLADVELGEWTNLVKGIPIVGTRQHNPIVTPGTPLPVVPTRLGKWTLPIYLNGTDRQCPADLTLTQVDGRNYFDEGIMLSLFAGLSKSEKSSCVFVTAKVSVWFHYISEHDGRIVSICINSGKLFVSGTEPTDEVKSKHMSSLKPGEYIKVGDGGLGIVSEHVSVSLALFRGRVIARRKGLDATIKRAFSLCWR